MAEFRTKLQGVNVYLKEATSQKGNKYAVLELETGQRLIDINIKKGVFIDPEIADILKEDYK